MKYLGTDDGSPTLEYIQNMNDFSEKLNELPNSMIEIKKSFDNWLLELEVASKGTKKVNDLNKKYSHYQHKIVNLETERQKHEEKSKTSEKTSKRIIRVTKHKI